MEPLNLFQHPHYLLIIRVDEERENERNAILITVLCEEHFIKHILT